MPVDVIVDVCVATHASHRTGHALLTEATEQRSVEYVAHSYGSARPLHIAIVVVGDLVVVVVVAVVVTELVSVDAAELLIVVVAVVLTVLLGVLVNDVVVSGHVPHNSGHLD